MKIKSLRIQNFRCFLDSTILFDDYTCLVGPGGVGKSTILTALRIFFRDTADSPTDLLTLQEQDFYQRLTDGDIAITVVFDDLEPEAQKDFAHYFRQGELVVSAVAKWDPARRCAVVKQFGERMVMAEFRSFFEAEESGSPISDLREIYSKIRTVFADLPAANTKPAMIEALHAFEAKHIGRCKLLQSGNEFYGATKGTNLLQKYIQWVFIPAVKDASTEQIESQKASLGALLERTVRTKMSFSEPLAKLRAEIEEKYTELLRGNQGALETLSKSLTGRLKDWAHPKASLRLSWREDSSRSISITEPVAEVLAGEGGFEGNLSRFGHGFQRSFLLALLQELSGCRDTGNPRLILGCEEPELYQHPPQARHLSSVLQKLSRSNTQVIISTHSPYFISGRGFQDVRVIRYDPTDDQPMVGSITFEDLSQKLAEARGEGVTKPTEVEFKVEQALQSGLNEMFFAPVLILVEGLEDFAYVSTYFTLTERTEEFRRLGCHIVTTSGKGSMIQPLAIAKLLGIPTFVVFDADGDATKPSQRAQHEQDNLSLLRLCSVAEPNPFPATTFATSELVLWPTKIGTIVKEEMGEGKWEQYEGAVRQRRKILDVGHLDKNMLLIGQILTEAFNNGTKSPILDGLCTQILAFARNANENESYKVASEIIQRVTPQQ